MEKERRIKIISAIALIVAVLGLTVAFAVLSTNLVINGTAKVDPGKWDIHFEELSEAKTKGGATADETATINTNEPTKIEDINVTLTKPMDEVTYTVNLVNKGDIDAEISSINLPTFSDEEQKYIEFNAIYDSDKKIITNGDVLKGNTTEKVTISIKFKEDVTELPKNDLNVNLSYEINYVQTDKDDEEVHKGEANVPKINYEGLNQGDIVKLGDEEFYVIENGDTELKLLAKYNLLVGNEVNYEGSEPIVSEMDKNTLGYGRQNPNAGYLESEIWNGVITFAKKEKVKKIPECDERHYGFVCYYGYWVDDSENLLSKYKNSSLDSYPAYVYDDNSNLYEPIQDYKLYIESLGYNVKEARLITYEEAVELNCNPPSEDENEDVQSDPPAWLSDRVYWTGSASDSHALFAITGPFSRNSCMDYAGVDDESGMVAGLRPIVILNK